MTRLFLTILAADLVVTFFVVVGPTPMSNSRVARLHHSYIVPGPFFDAKRIVDSYTLAISWKSGQRWSDPISPAKDHFIDYATHLDPWSLYRSRLERALYQGPVLMSGQSEDQIRANRNFIQLTHYLSDRYNSQSDSSCIWIIRKRASDFHVATDTIFVLKYGPANGSTNGRAGI